MKKGLETMLEHSTQLILDIQTYVTCKDFWPRTLNLCSSLSMRNEVSHPYKTRDDITVCIF
jgi:hypothetical protein